MDYKKYREQNGRITYIIKDPKTYKKNANFFGTLELRNEIINFLESEMLKDKYYRVRQIIKNENPKVDSKIGFREERELNNRMYAGEKIEIDSEEESEEQIVVDCARELEPILTEEYEKISRIKARSLVYEKIKKLYEGFGKNKISYQKQYLKAWGELSDGIKDINKKVKEIYPTTEMTAAFIIDSNMTAIMPSNLNIIEVGSSYNGKVLNIPEIIKIVLEPKKEIIEQEKRIYRIELKLIKSGKYENRIKLYKIWENILKEKTMEKIEGIIQEEEEIQRKLRGGIDNINLYIEEKETEDYYIPDNLKCFYKCLEKSLGKEYCEIKLNEYKENEKNERIKKKVIKNLLNNETNNNQISKNGISMFEKIAEIFKIKIKIRKYEREEEELQGENEYACEEYDKIVRLYEYDIKIKNIEEKRKTLNPYVKDINVLEQSYSGKHVILCKKDKFSKNIIKSIINNGEGDLEIIELSDKRIKEDIVNDKIIKTLKPLRKKEKECIHKIIEKDLENENEENEEDQEECKKCEEREYKSNENIFTFDIETTESNDYYTENKSLLEKMKIQKNKRKGKQFVEIKDLQEDSFRKLLGKKALLDSIQLYDIKDYKKSAYEKVEIIEKKEMKSEKKEEEMVEKFLKSIISKIKEENCVTKTGKKYSVKEATVYGFNTSRFDLQVLLEHFKNITCIKPKKIVKSGSTILCLSIDYMKIKRDNKGKMVKNEKGEIILEPIRINFVDLLLSLGGLGTLQTQCANFNIDKKYAKINLKDLTKKTYKELKEEKEENLLEYEKILIKEYEKPENEKKRVIIEEMMYIDIRGLLKLNEKQQNERKYTKNGETKTLKEWLDLYAKNDVISLMMIYEKFEELVKKCLKIDIKTCYTAPGIAGKYLRKNIDKEYRYVTSKEINFNIFDKAVFGGICFSRVNKYKANEKTIKFLEEFNEEKVKEIEEIKKESKNNDTTEVIKEYLEKNEIDDPLLAVDFNGLYSSAFLMDYNYSTENSPPVFINNDEKCEEIKNEINRGIFKYNGYICADIKTQKNTTIPILINKNEKTGELIYSNADKTEKNVYCLKTIEDAYKYTNIKIDKIHYILKYEEKRDILAGLATKLIKERLIYKLAMGELRDEKTIVENYKNLKEIIKRKIEKIFSKEFKDEFTKEQIEKSKKYFLEEEINLFNYNCKGLSDEKIKEDAKNYKNLCSQLEQLFKLISNSMYGKTLERPRFEKQTLKKIKDICVNDCEKMGSMCECYDKKQKPIINGQVLCTLYDQKKEITSSRDIGANVLANSKSIVYNGINILQGFFNDNILYTDTDSFYTSAKNIRKIEELSDDYLPFCLKTNEIEFKKGCFSLITELYSTGQKNKLLKGYYYDKEKGFIKYGDAKFTMKGFKSYSSEAEKDKLKSMIMERLEITKDMEETEKFIKKEIKMNADDIIDLCEKRKPVIRKILSSWKKTMGLGVIIDSKIDRQLKLDINETKYTIKEENGIIYRYPENYKE